MALISCGVLSVASGIQLRTAIIASSLILFGVASIAWATSPLTLEEAWERAEQANPTFRRAQTNLLTAEALIRHTRPLLANNPEVGAEWARRRIPEPDQTRRTRDYGVSLAQRFETAGQQGIRRRAAEDNLTAVSAEIADARRQMRSEVAQRFFTVLGLQSRAALAHEAAATLEEIAAAVQKRLKAGEDTRLDENLAQVEAARARNQARLLEQQLQEARAELAVPLQLPPEQLPDVAESAWPTTPSSLDALLQQVENRPDLLASQYRVREAERLLRLQRAATYPDVTIGLSAVREGSEFGDEKIAGINLSVPLPLFSRNAEGIGRALAELSQRQIQDTALQRDARAEVRRQWLKLESLRARVTELEERVERRLQENRRLSQFAFQEGEIGIVGLLLVTRQLLDSRNDLLEAQNELRLTRIELEAAAGWGPFSQAVSQGTSK
jgi:outer membrane protein, heavy metal efflux system